MTKKNIPDLPRGVVFSIQRMSTEDGPGIRTTVFFKGCTLKCIWCHNPESISPRPQIQWIGVRCIGCRTCLDVCPNRALSLTPEGISINREQCKGCGTCATECPSTALELLGKQWELEDLIDEVEKDRAYYEKSEGGITVSGGEPTLQAEFVAGFLRGCKEKGLHTALDTCGQCTWESLEMLLPYADMVLYDIKETDPDRHKAFTGHPVEKILENLIHLRDYMKTCGIPKTLWVRTPIIPDATARDESIRAVGRFIAMNMRGVVSRWELCSFNNLCMDKYIRLGLPWHYKGFGLLTEAVMERLAEVARCSGVDPDIVHWSGATSVEEDEGPGLRLLGGRARA
jgi:pyruvate formate lyase activating enzyme